MQEIIIIGAPRSGTNMLRDVLTNIPGFATWPCDEINLMWRHGNRREPSDQLTAQMARPEVRRYLRRQFANLAQKRRANTVVEKTCANSLRVDFVARVFPKAKYLFIYRDGVDAAASAMRRWGAPLDLRYTAAKARFVPATDLPYYGAKFVRNARFSSRASAVRSDDFVDKWWGPKPEDRRELQARYGLDELCLMQWKRCVDASLDAMNRLSTDQVLSIGYEDFVESPGEYLRQMLDFIGRPMDFDSDVVASVSNRSIGKGRRLLGEQVSVRLETLARDTMGRLGYA